MALLAHVLDVVILFGRLEAGLGALPEWPVKARERSEWPDQPRRLLDNKSVVMQDADDLGFDIGGTVEGIHDNALREPGFSANAIALTVKSRRRRSSMRVAGENHRGLTGFLVVLEAGHADFRAHVAGQAQVEGLEIVIDSGKSHTGLFKVLLQFEGIALD